MTAKPDNPPAFPTWPLDKIGVYPGMSLRDWFAGQIASGLIRSVDEGPVYYKNLAAIAYDAADAMLTERTKTDDR